MMTHLNWLTLAAGLRTDKVRSRELTQKFTEILQANGNSSDSETL